MTKMSKIVFTNGCFDVLHPLHFNLLVECRRIAGRDGEVIVALDSDEKVTKDKGIQRPFFTYAERERQFRMLENGKTLVDRVCSFDTNEELHSLIVKLKPDCIVKGSDWKSKEVIGSDVVAEVQYVQYDPRISTTSIANRIVQKTLQYDFRNEVINAKIDPYDLPEK